MAELFDLDDTLLDFSASEELSFFRTLQSFGINSGLEELLVQYRIENRALWKLFEEAKTTKEQLKVERFRRIFEAHQIAIDPELTSKRYLDTLPETVVLIDCAAEICKWLSQRGELGIITNGIHHVQTQRIKNSAIAPFVSFVCVSESSGYAKPDIRFFEHAASMAKHFDKARTLVVGDRLDIDILGANNFGVNSCWYNPRRVECDSNVRPTYQIKNLAELKAIIS